VKTPDALLLDFDQTLYSSHLPTLKAVDDRINLYIHQFLGLQWDASDALRTRAYKEFGTTLEGLRQWYGISPDHFFDFIQDVPIEYLPLPHPGLRKWLATQTLPLFVFTNARRDWVERCMEHMGLAQELSLFFDIIDITKTAFQGKPQVESYQVAQKIVGQALHLENPQLCLIDDHEPNIQMAHKLGWYTVWIDKHKQDKESLNQISIDHLSPISTSGQTLYSSSCEELCRWVPHWNTVD